MDTAQSEQVQQRLASMLEFIETGMREGKAFALDQAPEVAREMIAWGIWSNTLGIVGCTFVAVVCIVWLKVSVPRCVREWQEPSESSGFWAVFGIVGGIVAAILILASVIGVGNGVTSLIKASVAPRLYIIEQLRK